MRSKPNTIITNTCPPNPQTVSVYYLLCMEMTKYVEGQTDFALMVCFLLLAATQIQQHSVYLRFNVVKVTKLTITP